jgi:diguanylate cyclase (GGDEF)-like protein
LFEGFASGLVSLRSGETAADHTGEHEQDDESSALRKCAALLKSSVRGSDAVFRYGGDEFLIILADTSRTGAAKVIERIRAYLLDWNRAATLEGFELNLSIGVSEWSDDKTLDQLLDEADREMYAAKANPTLSKHRPSLVRALAQKIGL